MFYKKWQTEIICGIFCVFVLVNMILGILSSSNSAENIENTADQDLRAVEIYPKSGKERRSGASDYDATSDYVFISYSSRQSVIDVFDWQGGYVFSFRLPDQQNGGLSIQCQDNLLYVHLKNGNVLVFDGDCPVSAYSAQEAKEQELDYFWFESPSKTMTLKGLTFYGLDQNGERQNKIPIPGRIAYSYYAPYRTLLVVVLGFTFVICNRFPRRKRRQQNACPTL